MQNQKTKLTIRITFLLFWMLVCANTSKAEQVADSIQAELHEVSNVEDKIDLLISYSNTLRHIDTSQALRCSELATDIAEANNSESLLEKVYQSRGIMYSDYANFDSSELYLKKSLALSLKLNHYPTATETLKTIGRDIYSQGDYSTALKYYFEALEIYKVNNFKDVNLGWVYRYTGSVFKRQGNIEEALSYYQKALAVFLEFDHKKGIASSYNNIGISYGILGDRDKEMEYYFEALAIVKEINALDFACIYLGNIGYILHSKGKTEEALDYYHQAFDIAEQLKDKSVMAEFKSHIGNLHQEKGEYELALEHYLEAKDFAFQSERKQTLRLELIYFGLSSVYDKLNDTDNAFKYYKLYIRANSSLNNTVSVREIDELQNQHEKEISEQRIAQLEVEQQLKDEKLKVQQNLLNFLLFGIIGILLFTGIIYFQKHKLSLANKDLVRKNIEITQSEIQLEIKREPKTVSNISSDSIEQDDLDKNKGSNLTETQKDELIEIILFEVETNKIFKQDDLTVTKFANQIESNRAYISQVINERSNKNFNTFINEYRIKEARKMILERKHENITLEAIANSVGFKSKSAFNSSFKKFTGITPSYFLKSIEKEVIV